MAHDFSSLIDFYARCKPGDTFTQDTHEPGVGRMRSTVIANTVTERERGMRDVNATRVSTAYLIPAHLRSYKSEAQYGVRIMSASARGYTSMPGVGEKRVRLGETVSATRYSAAIMTALHNKAMDAAHAVSREPATV